MNVPPYPQLLRPPDWKNPVNRGPYDFLVLGGGTAGLVASKLASALGARTALVEKGLLGGDCLNRGCVPSKSLLESARAAKLQPSKTAFSDAMETMRAIRAQIAENDSAAGLREAGVDLYLGEGRFFSGDSLAVGGTILKFRRALIACGAGPRGLDLAGLSEAGYLSSETLFELRSRPPRMAVLGGGPLGCEMGQAFQRLGSRVSLFSDAPGLLPREDRDAASVVAKALRNDGLELRLGAKIRAVERKGRSKNIVGENHEGPFSVPVDEILVCVGRVPRLDGLGLEAAGVGHSDEGVLVDDHLRTRNPRIFAAGDAVPGPRFTHAAEAQARLAVRNALFPLRKRGSSLVVPRCLYTDPELAQVGLQGEEASSLGSKTLTLTLPLDRVDRSRLQGRTEGFARVHVSPRSGKLLGATLVAPHAGESIAEMSLAMTCGLPLQRLSGVIHPYPTVSECWKRLGDEYLKRRFSPGKRKLLRFVMRVVMDR